MTPSTYDFKTQYKGDTFKGVRLTFTKTVSEVTTPLSLVNASIKMQLKRRENTESEKTFTIGDGITVIDAENGIIKIDPFLIRLSAFKYKYDLQITFEDGIIRTYIKGFFDVQQDITD